MKLRPYQETALTKIKTKLQSGCNRQLVKWPTGLGKTVLFSSLPDTLDMQGRMLVLVHREELATQAADKLEYWNPSRSIGVEMADSRAMDAQLVVAGVQTLGTKNNKRLAQLNPADFDVVVVDEAHHSTSETYRRIIDHFDFHSNKSKLLLGVTATPNRADGIGLGHVFDEIVDDISLPAAIKDGWLVDIKGFRIRTGASLDKVHRVAGDFNTHELSTTINTPELNDLTARAWLEHGENRQTVFFNVDVQHAQDMAEAFKRYGVAAEAVWGGDPKRAEKLEAHRKGKMRVAMNVYLLSEGYDDWRVSCIGLTRPSESESLITQFVGRGTRIPEGIDNLNEARLAGVKLEKEDLLVLDFVNNSSKHSLVTLPTLFGLGVDTDLRGKSIVTILDEVERIKLRKPTLNIEDLKDVNRLEAYAEEVDLFKVNYPPEIIQISEYQWHRTGINHYVLVLTNREAVNVFTDILGKWYVVGTVNGISIAGSKNSLQDVIVYADSRVKQLGGVGLLSLIKRKAKWHDGPPTDLQKGFCERHKIVIPIGATKGEVAKKMTEKMAQWRGVA